MPGPLSKRITQRGQGGLEQGDRDEYAGVSVRPRCCESPGRVGQFGQVIQTSDSRTMTMGSPWAAQEHLLQSLI